MTFKEKVTEKAKNTWNSVQLAEKLGKETGIKWYINHMNLYRKFSQFIFIFGILFSIAFRNWTFVLILYCSLHLHMLVNETWWKIREVEEKIIESENKFHKLRAGSQDR